MHETSLINLAEAHKTDKWGRHFYAQHYDRFFAGVRHHELNVLEIGIGGYDDPGAGGESLRMWKGYFSRAKIYGIDIFDKKHVDEARIKTFKGSQADAAFLQSVVNQMGGVDIVIDDGSHVNEHVRKSFDVLFPMLNEGGIYAVEDTQTSYWPHRGGDSFDLNNRKCSMSYFKSLADGLNYEEFDNPYYKPNYTDKNIVGVHFFHNMVFIEKGANSEGSNICVANRMGQKTFMQDLRYLKRHLLSMFRR